MVNFYFHRIGVCVWLSVVFGGSNVDVCQGVAKSLWFFVQSLMHHPLSSFCCFPVTSAILVAYVEVVT